MELQFEEKAVGCIMPVYRGSQRQEQTQEVRLTEDQPDIGRILGAWGTPLIRGKQWRSGSMEVSGGVLAFALYQPEDGGIPRYVQCWLPVSARFDLPQTRRDGTILARCHLAGVDARSASARKLILRASMDLEAEAMVPGDTPLYTPGQVPEDLRLKKDSWQVLLPTESGEKPFTLEQMVQPEPAAPKAEGLVRYELLPVVEDRKIMADKVVFRGSALFHGLCMSPEGRLFSWDIQLPFSQFAQLDREHEADAQALLTPALTSLEAELTEEGLHLKAGLTCQYLICDRQQLDPVTDAYSNRRTVKGTWAALELPGILEPDREEAVCQGLLEAPMGRPVDIAFYPALPEVCQGEEEVRLAGTFQVLSYGPEGALQLDTVPWEGTRPAPQGLQRAEVGLTAWPTGENGQLQAVMSLDLTAGSGSGRNQLSGLELGEERPLDPERPSLILRRAGDGGLWQLAKESGSTAEAISKANGLEGDPKPGQLLLIPVE